MSEATRANYAANMCWRHEVRTVECSIGAALVVTGVPLQPVELEPLPWSPGADMPGASAKACVDSAIASHKLSRHVLPFGHVTGL
eukprot:12597067-Alexandrium_andersonii.AAC.1